MPGLGRTSVCVDMGTGTFRRPSALSFRPIRRPPSLPCACALFHSKPAGPIEASIPRPPRFCDLPQAFTHETGHAAQARIHTSNLESGEATSNPQIPPTCTPAHHAVTPRHRPIDAHHDPGKQYQQHCQLPAASLSHPDPPLQRYTTLGMS